MQVRTYFEAEHKQVAFDKETIKTAVQNDYTRRLYGNKLNISCEKVSAQTRNA
jgi:hypothetical protein